MRHLVRPVFAVLSTLGLLAAVSLPAIAQSGSRSYPPNRSSGRTYPPQRLHQSPAGSSRRAQPQTPVALEGYCPVSLKTVPKWVKGVPSIQTTFDGHAYHFANQQGKKMFLADPAKYVPVLGGDCVVSLVKMGKRVRGSVRHAALHEGRLFLFANKDGKKIFLANPKAYANADLAYGGNCVVCSLNMRRTVAGRPEFTVFHKGLRYLFPAAGQRDQFLANPQQYAALAAAVQSPPAGSTSRQPPGSGSGSR